MIYEICPHSDKQSEQKRGSIHGACLRNQCPLVTHKLFSQTSPYYLRQQRVVLWETGAMIFFSHSSSVHTTAWEPWSLFEVLLGFFFSLRKYGNLKKFQDISYLKWIKASKFSSFMTERCIELVCEKFVFITQVYQVTNLAYGMVL